MPDSTYQPTTAEVSARRKALAPEIHESFERFSKAVFAEGALPEKIKQLIAVAVAHVTQCPFCITGHTKLASRKGASPQEIMEAISGGCGDAGRRCLRTRHDCDQRLGPPTFSLPRGR